MFTRNLHVQSHFAYYLILVWILQRMWDFPQMKNFMAHEGKVTPKCMNKAQGHTTFCLQYQIVFTVTLAGPVVCEVLHTCDVSSSQNLQLREIQCRPQSHSTCKWQNRDWIPRSSTSESFFVPEIKLFTLSHAFLLHEHLHFKRKEELMSKVKKILFVGKIVWKIVSEWLKFPWSLELYLALLKWYLFLTPKRK